MTDAEIIRALMQNHEVDGFPADAEGDAAYARLLILLDMFAGALERPPLTTYYESRTKDGGLWCGSRDPDEVRDQSRGYEGMVYMSAVTYPVSVPVAWDPS